MNAIQFFDWGGKGNSFLKRIYNSLVINNIAALYADGHQYFYAKALTIEYDNFSPKERIILEMDFTKIPLQANFVYIEVKDNPFLESFKQLLSWEVDGVDINNNSWGMSDNKLNILPSLNGKTLRKEIEKEKLIIKILKKQ